MKILPPFTLFFLFAFAESVGKPEQIRAFPTQVGSAFESFSAPVRDHRFVITDFGAVGDSIQMNTKPIQAAIDKCTLEGGGTVVVPAGRFLTGALFVKAGISMELCEGAVLVGSKSFDDYPILENARIEGHFQERISALLNVAGADGFRLFGRGSINGNGVHYWAIPGKFGRPKICVIRDSRNVFFSGVSFMESPSWNLHLYNCRDALVENCRFEIPKGTKGPSTDGVVIDSCQQVTVKDCVFSVNDDCVCLKGNRYDGLNQLPESPPVKSILVENCIFLRGHGALALGTEAQSISDVEMRNCTIQGDMPMLRVKLRPDTPNQHYWNIYIHHNRGVGAKGEIVRVYPYHGSKVATPAAPISKIHSITIEDISGKFGTFGTIVGGTTATVEDIVFRNIDVAVDGKPELFFAGAKNVVQSNVSVLVPQNN